MPIRENKNANFVNLRKFSLAKITESTVYTQSNKVCSVSSYAQLATIHYPLIVDSDEEVIRKRG